jgi:hypothetical protein
MKPWKWTRSGVVLERELEGATEQLWVTPHLPPPSRRRSHPLLVELVCWLPDLGAVNRGLCVMREHFGRDSVLAGIRRLDDSTRVLIQTAAPQARAQERCLVVRAVLRPTAMGMRVVKDPTWCAVTALLLQGRPEPQDAQSPMIASR